MATHLGRRDFIAALGGAAAWPLAAYAQQPAMPVIGFLNSASPGAFEPYVRAFRLGLKEAGFIEGQNVMIEYRWAEGHFDRLPELAADLVQRKVAVIAATGGPPSALAAKAASVTTPIVFVVASDPIKLGLVASFNRPGGNITGASMLAVTVEPKKLEFLHSLVPRAVVIGLLVNPGNPNGQIISANLQTAARTLGLQMQIVKAATAGEFDAAFATLVEQRVGALVVAADPIFNAQREALVAQAARNAIPTIYEWSEFVAAGGLISYGTILSESYRQAGVYAGRILKGEKPAELPVVQPTRFELVINRKTAKALGLTIPETLLATADKVIE
jgi:putative ABC transport system substrate-binding protein